MDIKYFNNLIIRTPVGSINELKSITKIDNIGTDGLKFIHKTFDAYFKTALYYASQDLYFEIVKSINENQLSDKVFYSYTKYYIRFCSRCTPFGLFSTYGLCEINNNEKLTAISINDAVPKLRISLSYIYEICAKISKSKTIWEFCFLVPNQTVYKLENKIRYSEFYIQNNENNFRLSSIENNEVLNYILVSIDNGLYFDELSKLVQEIGYSYDEVKDYLFDLIENNLILLDIFPSPSSNNYIGDFLLKLSQIKKTQKSFFLKINQ